MKNISEGNNIKTKFLKEEYLKVYKDFEDYFKKSYKNFKNFSDDFIRSNEFLKSDFEYWRNCRNIRNIFSHVKEDEIMIDLNKNGLEIFKEKVNSIIDPPLADSICTKKIFKAKEDEKISVILSIMKENNIKSVPIINEKNEVIGMFNKNTLFLYMCDNLNNVNINDLCIFDLKKYYKLNNNKDNKYKFISRDTTISDILQYFDNKSPIIYSGLLVTENGKANQGLYGIITRTDVYNYLIN